ncbi:MAG: hypothetical protein MUO64_15670, partial [Anaerolineales bacterium]|nr:hypothetical protein [Anaerolineales bacterium]
MYSGWNRRTKLSSSSTHCQEWLLNQSSRVNTNRSAIPVLSGRCSTGHVLSVLKGQLITELKDGRVFTLNPGMSYL